MDFKHEYQNEMQRLSPTDEQLDRIKNGVERRLAEPQTEPKKKPMFIKIAAISGSSVCATAVLLFALIGVAGRKDIILNGTDAAAPSASSGNGGFGFCNMAGDAEGNELTEQSPSSDRGSIGGTTDGMCEITSTSKSQSSSSTWAGGSTLEDPESPGGSKYHSPDVISDILSEYGISESTETPFLIFLEDEDLCSVILNGQQLDYTALKSDINWGTEENSGGANVNDESLRSASSNLGIELFVQFDENCMTVFTENGKFYKQYILN